MSIVTATAVRLEAIRKSYSEATAALHGVDLQVNAGEWLVVVGPSGCGKTSLLRIIAGLEKPTEGTVWLNGSDAAPLPPWQRRIAMVFQRPALAPTQSIEQNLASGLKKPDPARINAIAESLGLRALLSRLPHQLSGGEQQRVALGRALAKQAPLCLLDEPLSHIDAPQRDELRQLLKAWHLKHPATMISVTHDPQEAWTLGERIAVMDAGRVIQVGSPREVHEQPFNRFVAQFFTCGPMNFLEVRLRSEGNSLQWTASDWPQPIPCATADLGVAEASIGLRAEHASVGDGLPMVVTLVEPTPRGCWVTGECNGRRITAWTTRTVSHGEKVGIMMNWTRAFVFDRVTGRTLYAPGA